MFHPPQPTDTLVNYIDSKFSDTNEGWSSEHDLLLGLLEGDGLKSYHASTAVAPVVKEHLDSLIEFHNRHKEFLDSSRDIRCGTKTIGELASHLPDISSEEGVIFPLPSPEGPHVRPTSIQLTGLERKVLFHREAMTQAILRDNRNTQALITAVQSIADREISATKAEMASLTGLIDDEIASIDPDDIAWNANENDLQNLKKLLKDGYQDLGEGQGTLKISLASFPELQEGVPVPDPAGRKRFLGTLVRNALYREWRINSLVSQAALRRKLTPAEDADLMRSAFLTEVIQYASPPGFHWGMKHLSAQTPSQHNDRVQHGQTTSDVPQSEFSGILTEVKKLLLSRDTESVMRASAARACEALRAEKTCEDPTASEMVDPGPIVADYYSKDPFEYAFEDIKDKVFDTEETDSQCVDSLRSLEAEEPYLPHQALPGFRDRVAALATVSDKDKRYQS
ncbi:hypothetical protein I302_106077 [Kwoniella bestiolae CBS 10118]|uniref:Uncharacterized protein n=1 Tax=Kwoniella bestiolae CBS 10118 TaxID=1296100 RepID=A0A1B9G2Y7_9TREE|nr:hypothetical protein I302_05203 [Kwoniella bestiolae CBS 10118]OCF25384.1 hypothetical protein I302_05203 [Kwoniella bestiolae CBS 10118]